MRYHHLPTRRAKIQNTDNTKGGKDVEQQEQEFFADGNAKWYGYFGRQLGIYYKAKHKITQSSNHATSYLFK